MMMTDLAFISETRPPWLLMTQREITQRDVPDGILLVEADAALMMNWGGVFYELAAVFQFPDYFGKNYNALDDCITDLDWLPAEGYLLVIKNSASLLIEESDDDDLEGLLYLLSEAGKEWATPVNIGEWWDREGLPFHTILQMSEDEMPGFRSRLEKPRFEIGIL